MEQYLRPEDMRNRPFLDRKAALARLLRHTEAGILFNEHITEDGPSSSRTRAGLVNPTITFSTSGSRSDTTASFLKSSSPL